MAVFKCKMCGGDLEVQEGSAVCECEYCGTKQTIPTVKDEILQNLFNRANNLRIKCDFDRAEEIYEKILDQDEAQAEAHWGLVLCKYGIEYVEDPKTLKRIPTCHRASFDSVSTDVNFLAALEHAARGQKTIYREEGKAIEKLQKDILAIAENEDPFDVFICYKETDENGKRTVDSTIANDIYYQLTQDGLKVFYAAITLEDKLGQEYEPYIFSALNSSKAMLVIGTRPEYFNAVWVKNEWSRFLKLMKKDRKKLLIPCYKDMDAYDLPEEFAHLQAQDMSKIGFINDVVRGIKKITEKKEKVIQKETIVVNESTNANLTNLLKRAFMSLEDGEFEKADEFCEQVLNQDPENAQAYLGKLMAQIHARKREDLKNCNQPFDTLPNYKKIYQFGDDELRNELTGYIEYIKERNEIARKQAVYIEKQAVYVEAVEKMNQNSEEEFKNAALLFETIKGFKDSAELCEECLENAEIKRKEKEAKKEAKSEKRKKRFLVFCCIVLVVIIVLQLTL